MHLLVLSASVLAVITKPESLLAGLYTATNFSTQIVLGRRSRILIAVVSELTYANVTLTKSDMGVLGMQDLIMHKYVS